MTDTFEPGSTIKPFIAAWAIESKRVTPQTMIATARGRISVGGSTISDAHPHGDLSVAQVVQKSSNVGTVRMAMTMQPREMWELFTQVGFGSKPQLDFPGAVSGRLRPYKSWRPIEQATMSYGYGLSTSLFQLARAYTVFARDGELIPVTMTKNAHPTAGLSVLSPPTARAVRADAADGCRAGRHGAEGAERPATRWAARPARRTSRKARATRPTSTAPGSSAWRRSAIRASSSR